MRKKSPGMPQGHLRRTCWIEISTMCCKEVSHGRLGKYRRSLEIMSASHPLQCMITSQDTGANPGKSPSSQNKATSGRQGTEELLPRSHQRDCPCGDMFVGTQRPGDPGRQGRSQRCSLCTKPRHSMAINITHAARPRPRAPPAILL
jgi:hypothetical protein